MKVIDKKIIFLAIVLITAIDACVKSHDTPAITPGTSIAGIVKDATNLTLLDSAMSKTDLIPTFDSLNPVSVAAPFTFFAPLNIAFTNLGFTDSTIYKYNKDSLKRLILYHVIAGQKLYLATLPQGPNAAVRSASGDSLYITVSGGNIYVNGNLVTSPDINAANGVIQGLAGAVLIPPSGNILQTLDSLSVSTDTTLSFLVAALNRASQGSINLNSLLSGGNVFTILAPTNSAFAALGDTAIANFNNYAPDSLARILQCHILSGRVFSSDFPQSGSLLSIATPQDSLTFAATINLTVQSKGDSSVAAKITSVNRLATNGVIHKIDKVLLP